MSGFFLTTAGKISLFGLGMFLLLGVWLVLSGSMSPANRKWRKIVKIYSGDLKKESQSSQNINAGFLELAKKFSKHIHLNKITQSEMEKALKMTDSSLTPNEYVAYLILAACIPAIMGLVVLGFGFLIDFFIFKFIGFGLLLIAIGYYLFAYRGIFKKRESSVRDIEIELPRFVSYIRINLEKGQQEVLVMLENYIPYKEKFKEQMSLTLADAKTSNFDGAVSRLDRRVNSDLLKQVIHGLIGANHGDDMLTYFAILEKEMENFEKVLLKQNVKTIPKKMMIPKILMVTALILAFAFPIIVQVVDSFKVMFMS